MEQLQMSLAEPTTRKWTRDEYYQMAAIVISVIPVVVAFDQMEDLLLARRTDDGTPGSDRLRRLRPSVRITSAYVPRSATA